MSPRDARPARITAKVELPISAKWQRYEQKKANWQHRHPDATPSEFTQACMRFAKSLGL